MGAYDDLMAFVRQTEAVSSVAGRTAWDQETMMPPGAAAMRGEEMAALEAVIHARTSDPRIGDWLAQVGTPEDPVAAAQVGHIRRSYERAVKVPANLAVRLAQVTSLGQGDWAAARRAEDWDAFAPRLAEIVALKRDEAEAIAEGGDPYDALLQDYEPGTDSAEIATLFDALRPPLVALRDRIAGTEREVAPICGIFPPDAQMSLAREMALAFGYDLERGRIDTAVHPFSSGSGHDVRITTRSDPADPFNCLYSTIHEVGHATYEQRIDPGLLLTPSGRGASMGVHESQSRIYENQMGRGRAFTGWLFGRMRAVFGEIGVADADAFHAAVNRVATSFIRTEADEVHYNLHIMLRVDLERELIAGRLAVGDLSEAWNARFSADFGREVDRPSHGVLQDVHWSVGLFGYFPTYTLGNVYAGCLWETLVRDVPEAETALAAGDPGPAVGWLADHVQRVGGLFAPQETIARATGAPPEAGPLIRYLEAKFGAIYGF